MSTFVVRFVGDRRGTFRGTVRHVATGEEVVFTSVRDLVAFLEGINALTGSEEEAVRSEAIDRRDER